ncbi:hypothetical protein BDZ89DRAFT_1063785 [Hymenopellis radicata]|nr:hypothetical protein BDZ89DRAFT_1063785 [Hymenopellis radicata]
MPYGLVDPDVIAKRESAHWYFIVCWKTYIFYGIYLADYALLVQQRFKSTATESAHLYPEHAGECITSRLLVHVRVDTLLLPAICRRQARRWLLVPIFHRA